MSSPQITTMLGLSVDDTFRLLASDGRLMFARKTRHDAGGAHATKPALRKSRPLPAFRMTPERFNGGTLRARCAQPLSK
jgi:hypothetical protein